MPDFWMDGKMWEVKSPIGKGKRTVEKLFSDIIIDLARAKTSDP